MTNYANPKLTFKRCSIICIITCIICLALCVLDFINQDLTNAIYDLIILVISAYITFFMIRYSKKSNEEIVKKRGSVTGISFLSIFSSIVIMIMTFICVNSINRYIFEQQAKNMYKDIQFNASNMQNAQTNENMQNAQTNENIQNLSLEEQQIQREVNYKVEKIKNLVHLKEQNLISEKEFNEMKKEILEN